MSSIIQDLRYGARTLLRERAFAAVAILTLALALGANSAIFTVLNAILLQPLPYAEPDRLLKVRVFSTVFSGGEGDQLAYPNIRDLRTLPSIENVAAYWTSGMFLMEGEEPELIHGADVESTMLPLLGVKPLLGRFFTAGEDRANAGNVLVISYDLWQRRFGGDPAVINRTARFGSANAPWRIVGVMPPGFKFPAQAEKVDFYAPLLASVADRHREARDWVAFDAVARLKNGATLEQAQSEAAALSERLEKEFPAANLGLRYSLWRLHDAVVKNVKRALLVLFGAVAAVLLIACSNVANLLLARAAARHKEISVRGALGATRGRIVAQLLIESILLSTLAGLAGLLLAAWGVDALLALAPDNIPRLENVALDTRVVGFTLTLAMLTGVLFGLAPALAASKPNLTESLKEGTRGSTEGLRRNRIRNVLVTASVALSLVLLAGAGLLLRSFMRISAIDPGFDYENAATLTIAPRSAVYKTPAEYLQFQERLRNELAAIPGVTAVASTNIAPLSGGENVYPFDVIGRPPYEPGRAPNITTVKVSPGYFQAMGIPLLRGRDIMKTDVEGSPEVVIVSKEFVRRHFPNEDPLGKRLQIGNGYRDAEIIGIAGDIRYLDLAADPLPMFYIAHAQSPSRSMTAIVRSPNAATLGPAMRAAVRRLDRQQPIVAIESLAEFRGNTLATRKFSLALLAMLAVVALLLAAVGIYSIMSYSVAQRTSEIGIRMSLGAASRDIFRLVVGNAVRLVGAGVLIGLAVSFAATRVMSSLLYGVAPTDPVTFGAICIVLVFVALVASWVPARRAARVDPLIAIRAE